MKALTKNVPVSLGVVAMALLIGCRDLSLADTAELAGGTAGVGGASVTGGRSTLVGSTPVSSGVAPLGGATSFGGVSASGGTAPSGGAQAVGGAATSGGGAPFGGTPSSGGVPSTVGDTTLGGVAGSEAAASGGIVTVGGVTGGRSTQPATGALTSTGGTTLATGGFSSTSNASTGGTTQQSQSSVASSGTGTGGLGSSGGTFAAATTSSGAISSGGEFATGGTSPLLTLNAGGTTASTDGGAEQPDGSTQTWEPCLNGQVTTLAQSPQTLAWVFVGCSNGDVYRTSNALSANPSWVKVDTWYIPGGILFLPDQFVNSIAYSPSDLNTVYVAFAGSKQGRKLWKTVSGGTEWVELSSVPLDEIWSLSVNPQDPLKLYVFGPGGPFMSADAGTTWTPDVIPDPLTVPIAAGAKLTTVSVAPGNPDVIWVGASNGDVFFTDDATSNQTWYLATHNMPARAVTHLALDVTRDPVGVYATFDGMYDDSLWVTANNGFGWALWQNAALPTSPVPVSGVYAFYGVSINPSNSTVLYIDGTYGAGLSTTGGTSWSWTNY